MNYNGNLKRLMEMKNFGWNSVQVREVHHTGHVEVMYRKKLTFHGMNRSKIIYIIVKGLFNHLMIKPLIKIALVFNSFDIILTLIKKSPCLVITLSLKVWHQILFVHNVFGDDFDSFITKYVFRHDLGSFSCP